MKAALIKTGQGFTTRSDTALGVKRYDKGNDFPQKVQDIVGASGTGSSCVNTYAKFIGGKGFGEETLAELSVNRKGHKSNDLLREVCKDFAMFGGVAIHVNYNALYRIVEMFHVPFEHCRLEAEDSEGLSAKKIAIHKDWTGREKKFDKKEIHFVDSFNPDPRVIEAQVMRSSKDGATLDWNSYKGQILYYAGSRPDGYPSPIFMSQLTNMRSEEGLDNVVGRNITCNFFSGGAFATVAPTAQSKEGEDEMSSLQNDLQALQGDENVGNIMVMQVESKEDLPQKIDLRGDNYDKEFSTSQEYVPARIGAVFMQPPILRAEATATGFATDVMLNAYNMYNSITEGERREVSQVFKRLFQYWGAIDECYCTDIQPKSYNVGVSTLEIHGKDVAVDVVSVISDDTLTTSQKEAILTTIYGIAPNQAVQLIQAE